MSACEDILPNKFDTNDDNFEDDVDENVLRERQCGRRMAVVLD